MVRVIYIYGIQSSLANMRAWHEAKLNCPGVSPRERALASPKSVGTCKLASFLYCRRPTKWLLEAPLPHPHNISSIAVVCLNATD